MSVIGLAAVSGAAAGLATAQVGPCPLPPIGLGGDGVDTQSVLLQFAGDPIVEPRKWVQPPDGTDRWFWIEQTGTVRVIQNGAIVPTPVLDIGSRLIYAQQRGFLGFVFHKDFGDANKPGYQKFYTWHTEPRDARTPDYPLAGVRPHQVVLTEWRLSASNPNLVDPASERELLRADHGSPVHSGGCMEFGPDGYMYISLGTTSNIPANAQDNSHPDGCILRIDPIAPELTPTSSDPVSRNGKYRIPADNPFALQPGLAWEIFAYGLRHPWQFSIDPVSGVILCGDVGQASYEEVNVIVRGGNYGWPYREGTCVGILPTPSPAPEMIDPLVEWEHDEGRSTSGAHVYRGSAIPELVGKLVTADLTDGSGGFFNEPGRLFYATIFDGSGVLLPPSQVTLEELRVGPNNSGLTLAPVAFGIDRQSELYLLGVVTPNAGAVVAKIVPAPPAGCYADCDTSTGAGVLDIFDFLCFQNEFAASAAYACECDLSTGTGVCDIFDFLCFQNAFARGCP